MAEAPRGRSTGRVFTTQSGSPKLVRCAVLFIDLLGVRQLNRSPDRRKHLVALERAVAGSYRDYLRPDATLPASFFSDTLVVAAPVEALGSDARAIDKLLLRAASLHVNLMAEGFFLRGGLALGEFHIHDGLIFGPALVHAAELEHDVAVHPRIVLSRDAERAQLDAASTYPSPNDAPQNLLLLRDSDGWTFIDYLAPLVVTGPKDPRPTLERHRDRICGRLEEHRANKRVWEKYRWAAEYHNDVIRRHLPGADDLYVNAASMTWQFQPFTAAA